MPVSEDYEDLAVESLHGTEERPFPSSWQGALVQAVTGLGWAVLAHMKREEERHTVVAMDSDPLRDFIESYPGQRWKK
jgi:hypothetical protein